MRWRWKVKTPSTIKGEFYNDDFYFCDTAGIKTFPRDYPEIFEPIEEEKPDHVVDANRMVEAKTLRDEFAMSILPVFIKKLVGTRINAIEESYRCADEMMKARKA